MLVTKEDSQIEPISADAARYWQDEGMLAPNQKETPKRVKFPACEMARTSVRVLFLGSTILFAWIYLPRYFESLSSHGSSIKLPMAITSPT